ncbi:MAG: tetratricopeptide repeat protein [Candidatus Gastranaerophilales bacterium]|nr:tetratricopeptide repeat protein [Candidatus Gastranaerophilales bacterium]
MIKFFKQVFNKIKEFDDYTRQYSKITNNIELPSLAYTNWGMHYAHLKDFEHAIEKLETAAVMSGQNPKPCINLGIIYTKLKNYQKAESILLEALRKDSHNPYTYNVLGSVYIAEDKFDKAEDMLKKALKFSTSNSEIFLNYGILYAKMQKKHKSIEMLKKSKLLNPANVHTYFILGVMLFETDRISEAFTEFKKLESMNSNYKNLNYYIALCYKKEKNYMAVIEYAQRALNDDEDNVSAYILLAQTYTALNKQEEMLRIYAKGAEHGINNFEFLLSWGVSLLKINKIKEAKAKLFKVIELKNNNSTALYKLGCCFYKEGNKDEAENYFNKALASNSLNSSALANLGIIYYERKDYQNAIQTFFKAIDISSEKAYLYFYIANCYYKLGRLKKSIDYYEKTTEYYPLHIEALINCTVCLLEMNNEKEALRKIRKAFQINRESEKVILIYSLTDLKAGIFSDAIEKADIILNKNPDKKEAKLLKVNALININKPQEALDILFSLADEDKNSDLCICLFYEAYKILVEETPSNYNENMLNFYLNKINKINETNPDILNQSGISKYISKILNINKG